MAVEGVHGLEARVTSPVSPLPCHLSRVTSPVSPLPCHLSRITMVSVALWLNVQWLTDYFHRTFLPGGDLHLGILAISYMTVNKLILDWGCSAIG